VWQLLLFVRMEGWHVALCSEVHVVAAAFTFADLEGACGRLEMQELEYMRLAGCNNCFSHVIYPCKAA
jgi:hypothetical protein